MTSIFSVLDRVVGDCADRPDGAERSQVLGNTDPLSPRAACPCGSSRETTGARRGGSKKAWGCCCRRGRV